MGEHLDRRQGPPVQEGWPHGDDVVRNPSFTGQAPRASRTRSDPCCLFFLLGLLESLPAPAGAKGLRYKKRVGGGLREKIPKVCTRGRGW